MNKNTNVSPEESLEHGYFDFLKVAEGFGEDAHYQGSNSDFVGDEPGVIKQYLHEWGERLKSVNDSFAKLKQLANDAHNLGL